MAKKIKRKFKKEIDKKYLEKYNDIAALKAVRWKINKNNFYNGKISSADKAKITRVHNNISAHAFEKFVKLNKIKGESSKKYNRRLSLLKKRYGQTEINEKHNNVDGIFISLPNFQKKSVYIDKDLKIKFNEYVTTEGYKRREEYIPLDREKFIQNPKEYLQKICEEYRPDRIAGLYHTGARREFEIDHLNLIDGYDNFIEFVIKNFSKYAADKRDNKGNIVEKGYDANEFLNGFKLVYYE